MIDNNEQNRIREDLSAYLDGELSEDRAAEVENGVNNSPALAAELAQLRTLSKLLSSMDRAKASAELADQILQQAERSSLVGSVPSATTSHSLHWLKYSAIAALLAVAACVGVVVFQHIPPRTSQYDSMGIDLRDETSQQASIDKSEQSGEPDSSPTSSTEETALAMADTEAKAEGELAETDDMLMPAPDASATTVRDEHSDTDLADSKPQEILASNIDTGFLIYTDNIKSTRSSVEELLMSNKLHVIGPVERRSSRKVSGKARLVQVQMKVLATRSQRAAIEQQLRGVQQSQNVSQMAMPRPLPPGEIIIVSYAQRPAARRLVRRSMPPAEPPSRRAKQTRDRGVGSLSLGVAASPRIATQSSDSSESKKIEPVTHGASAKLLVRAGTKKDKNVSPSAAAKSLRTSVVGGLTSGGADSITATAPAVMGKLREGEVAAKVDDRLGQSLGRFLGSLGTIFTTAESSGLRDEDNDLQQLIITLNYRINPPPK